MSVIIVTIGIKFQPIVCSRCFDLLIMSMNPRDIAILNVRGSDYRCIVSLISRNEAIKLMQNAVSTAKKRKIKKIKIFYHI